MKCIRKRLPKPYYDKAPISLVEALGRKLQAYGPIRVKLQKHTASGYTAARAPPLVVGARGPLWNSSVYLVNNGRRLQGKQCVRLLQSWLPCVDHVAPQPRRARLSILATRSPTRTCMQQTREPAGSAGPYAQREEFRYEVPTLV